MRHTYHPIPESEFESFQGLIFDCDGTLTDSMPLHYVAWKATMAAHGMHLTEERFYELAGVPTEDIIEMLTQNLKLNLEKSTLALTKENAFLAFMNQLQSIDVVESIVRNNFGLRKMAIASGGIRQVVEAQLLHLSLKDHFDAIVCAEDSKRPKPFPDIFLQAAERLKLQPSQCIVFEDADLGIQAAQSAGMKCIDVRTYRKKNQK